MILIPPHGNYRQLKSYQTTTLVYDLTVKFCQLFVDQINTSRSSYKAYSRLSDQMIQAARSGRQNIAEGCTASGTSKKTELKLIGVARASLEELLLDYEDYLRQHQLAIWSKTDPRVNTIRQLIYQSPQTIAPYLPHFNSPESAANCLICLIHQANYLLDHQLKTLEASFLKVGGFTERLYSFRKQLKPKLDLYVL